MKKRIVLLTMACFMCLSAGCGEERRAGGDPTGQVVAPPQSTSSDILVEAVEIICPWAPGGSSDINARTLGQVIGEMIGQPVTVSNITGGGGAVGFTAQRDAEPDGYTLGIITAELNTLPPQEKIAFTFDDIYPVIRMNTLPACIAVRADSPYQSLDDLVKYAREHPGALRNGHVGTGSIWHICAAKLETEMGIEFSHAAYDGASTAVNALVAEDLDLVILETSVCGQRVETGELRILAVMAENRLSSFPAYPTCKELGINVVAGSYQGIVCPAGVPDDKKREWERILTEAFYSQNYQRFCEEYGLEKSYMNAADFYTFLEEDLEIATAILKEFV